MDLAGAAATLRARVAALRRTAAATIAEDKGRASLLSRLGELEDCAHEQLERIQSAQARVNLGLLALPGGGSAWAASMVAIANGLLRTPHPSWRPARDDGDRFDDQLAYVPTKPARPTATAPTAEEDDNAAYFAQETVSMTAALAQARESHDSVLAEVGGAAVMSPGPFPITSHWNVPTHISFSPKFKLTIRYKPVEEVLAALEYLRQVTGSNGGDKSKLNVPLVELALIACGFSAAHDLSKLQPADVVIPRRFKALLPRGTYTVRSTVFGYRSYEENLVEMQNFLLKAAVGSWSSWSLIDAIRIELPADVLYPLVNFTIFGQEAADHELIACANEGLLQSVDSVVLFSSSVDVDSEQVAWLDRQGFFDMLYWKPQMPFAVVHKVSDETVLVKASLVQPGPSNTPLDQRIASLFNYQDVVKMYATSSLSSPESTREVAPIILQLAKYQTSLAMRGCAEALDQLVVVPLMFLENEIIWLHNHPLPAALVKHFEASFEPYHSATFRPTVEGALDAFYVTKLRPSLRTSVILPLLREHVQAELEKPLFKSTGDLRMLFQSISLVASWIMYEFSVIISTAKNRPLSMYSRDLRGTGRDMVDVLLRILHTEFLAASQPPGVAEKTPAAVFLSSRYFQTKAFLSSALSHCHQQSFDPIRRVMRQNCWSVAAPIVAKIHAVNPSDEELEGLLPSALDKYCELVSLEIQHTLDRSFEGSFKVKLGYSVEEVVSRYCTVYPWMTDASLLKPLFDTIAALGASTTHELHAVFQIALSQPV